MKSTFVDHLIQTYPALKSQNLNELISDNLLSPFKISLKRETVETIRSDIQKYWALREWGQKKWDESYRAKNLRVPRNFSVCMSYDFHINEAGQPELIEINTNAAFLALGQEFYASQKLTEPVSHFDANKVVQMFKADYAAAGHGELKKIYILDEKPFEQRLFIEFLAYKAIFEKAGIQTEIMDLPDLKRLSSAEGSAFIYNRYTDFYLQNEPSIELKNLFNLGQAELSPNPYEYTLLADKQRLIDWNLQTELEKPVSLLKTYDMGLADKDQVWMDRKSLFFKPKTSFGSKQAYRGSSISRKAFEEVANDQFIAQQFSQPAEIELNFQNTPQKYKYDLRCYVYKNELQMIMARLYQGQTTNLRSAGGGFALVEVV